MHVYEFPVTIASNPYSAFCNPNSNQAPISPGLGAKKHDSNRRTTTSSGSRGLAPFQLGIWSKTDPIQVFRRLVEI
jgi:hypothetical protein